MKGSSLVLTTDITTPPGSVTSYNFSVAASTTELCFCDMRVVRSGSSVCMDDNGISVFATTSGEECQSASDIIVGGVSSLVPDAVISGEENVVSET